MNAPVFNFEVSSFSEHDKRVFVSELGRELYKADCEFIEDDRYSHFSYSRRFLGYVPVFEHRANGIKTITRRTIRDIREQRSDTFVILLPINGQIIVTQNCQTIAINPGNFAILFSNIPLCISTILDSDRNHLSYHVVMHAHIINQVLTEPKRLCAMPFSCDQGGAKIALDLLLSLFNEAENLDQNSAETMVLSALNTFLQTVNGEGSEVARSIGVRELKLRRIMDYLELHYSDPDLTTFKAANACGISIRYLHYLLKSTGKKFNDYIWQARLSSARQQLANPLCSARTISDISYAVGFKNNAHFSRAFRRHFGRSPREFRHERLSGVALAECVMDDWKGGGRKVGMVAE